MSAYWNPLVQGPLSGHMPVWLWTRTSLARKEIKVEWKQPLYVLVKKTVQLCVYAGWGGGSGVWGMGREGGVSGQQNTMGWTALKSMFAGELSS